MSIEERIRMTIIQETGKDAWNEGVTTEIPPRVYKVRGKIFIWKPQEEVNKA